MEFSARNFFNMDIFGGCVTRFELFKVVKSELEKAQNFSESDALGLVALTLKIKLGEVRNLEPVAEELVKKTLKNTKKRIAGQPIDYIFKNADFFGREFVVNKNCLTPRPETEELVLWVASSASKTGKVLDLCTGSGAIAITLNLEFGFYDVLASDVSEKALRLARLNAKNLGAQVRFVKSDLFGALKTKFDVIVSNPPYISEQEFLTLSDEVKNFDPKIALVAEENGLYFYRRIIETAPLFLNEGGKLFFEVGHTQAHAVCKMLEKDFEDIEIKKDLEGQLRMVKGVLKRKK